MLDLSDTPPSHRLPVLRALIRIEQLRSDHHLEQAAEADEGSMEQTGHLARFVTANERIAELQGLLSSRSTTP